jgi:hypothetical protein
MDQPDANGAAPNTGHAVPGYSVMIAPRASVGA